jgi:uncharacterized repeat protein (TIGR02543 family)
MNIVNAKEAPTMNVTGGSVLTTNINTNNIVIFPDLEIVSEESIEAAKIIIQNLPSDCDINVPVSTSLISVEKNLSNNSISFNTIIGESPSVDDYINIIKQLTINTGASITSTDITFDLSIGYNDIYYLADTNHYYKFVNSPGITWENAEISAEVTYKFGYGGYLATITSAKENDFIATFCDGDGWLGASDSELEGEWKWVTGPESGSLVSYSNYNSGEPNNWSGDEDFLYMISSTGQWNDYIGTNSSVAGYVVEWNAPTDNRNVRSTLQIIQEPIYDITYNNLEGSDNSANPTQYSNSTLPETLSNISRIGYNFDGWYLNDTTLVTEISEESSEDKSLTARWSPINYNIIYDLIGGSNNVNNPTTYTIEDGVILLNPTKSGYNFIEWQEGNTITEGSTEVKTFTATWSIITYSVSYNLNGGSNNGDNPTEYTVEDSKSINNPSKQGYTFAGWKQGNTISKGSTGDKTFTANWNANQYNINYLLNGGFSNQDNPTKYTIEDNVTLNSPNKQGYSFVGWEQGSTISKGSTGDRTFTAKWNINNYKINYVLNDGINNDKNSDTYTIKDFVTLNNPTKEGNIFLGWEEGNVIKKGSVGEKTFTANWEIELCDLSYDANGGEGSFSEEFNPDILVELNSGDKFIKDGFILDGWLIEGETYQLGAIYKTNVGKVVAKAIWQEDQDSDGVGDESEELFGSKADEENDRPLTGNVVGYVLKEDGSPMVDYTIVLNSSPKYTTTNKDGYFEFIGVTLEPHVLTLRDGLTELGVYNLTFSKTEGENLLAENTEEYINASVNSSFISINLVIQEDLNSKWLVNDVTFNELAASTNILATYWYLMLAAIIGILLVIKRKFIFGLLSKKDDEEKEE